ncbi:hypothetical protein SCLCIDRAFT_19788 [Scleroderma citrinum Foug A]|uniref:Uncharacterized protein n=1 Tax=Scleroderma citrinum Foug A TaxID=1036808 RepID=A0A0C3AW48_9AGAM|nr:hypothetical protein SCLCIDRAFT_19788 [Scleroderma citrinum Foug A]
MAAMSALRVVDCVCTQALLQVLKAIKKISDGYGSRRINRIEWEEAYRLVEPLSSMSMPGSMDPVSVSAILRWANIYRFKFNSATLTAGCIDPMELIGGVPVWLRCASAFQFESTALALMHSKSNDSVQAFRQEFGWLRDAHASQVFRIAVYARMVDLRPL